MLLKFALNLLFFLPVIESFNRTAALFLLFSASIILAFSIFKKKKFHADLINILFLLFVAWNFFVSLFSISLIRSFTESLRYLAYFLIFAAIREAPDKETLTKFYKKMILGNIILLFGLFLAYSFFLKNLIPAINGMNLFYPVFGHNRISNLMIMAIPLLLGAGLKIEKKTEKVWSNRFILLSLILFFFSFGRGEWLALGVTLIIFLLFSQKFRSHYLKPGLIYITGISALILIIFLFSQFYISRKEGVYLYRGLYKPLNNEKRFEYYKQGLTGFLHSPILGSGPDTFRYISKKYQEMPYSWSWYLHNHFFQVFTETGFSGGLLFALLFMNFALKLIPGLKSEATSSKTIILMSVLPSVIHSFIDYDWEYISILLLVLYGIALILPSVKNKYRISILPIIYFALSGFVIWLFLYKDSDTLLRNRETKLSSLEYLAKIDGGYNEISIRLSGEYLKSGNYSEAHKWYRKAIIQDPLESAALIKTDYLLYIKEAKAKNSAEIFRSGNRRYPYFFEKSGISFPKSRSLTDVTGEMETFLTGNVIRVREIKEIIKNPDFIN